MLDGAPSSHASEVGGAERLLVVGLLEGKRQVDAVHDWVVGPHAAANLGDHVEAKAAPVRISSQLAVVEGGV